MTEFDMYYPKPSFVLSSKKDGKRNSQDDGTPKYGKKAFKCPHCGFYAQQEWETWKETPLKNLRNQTGKLETAQCQKCNNYSIWRMTIMIYPLTSSAPKADDNMPPKVKEIYEEARLVGICSPRAAAILLRVATERLTVHLGESNPKDNLDTRIGNLQKKNTLDPRAINSFDILRVTANEGAHDGLLKLTGAEGAKAVDDLFFAINYIVEKTISEPARLDQMYGKLPQGKLDGIKNRDKPKDKK